MLFFSWSRVPRGDTIVSTNGDFGGEGHRIGRGAVHEGTDSVAATERELGSGRPEQDTTETRSVVATTAEAQHAALQEPEGRFFCCQVRGWLGSAHGRAKSRVCFILANRLWVDLPKLIYAIL